MADSISAVLEFLHKHNFSVAESALRSELNARQEIIGPLSLGLSDEFDLSARGFFQAMQTRDRDEPEIFRPDPLFPVASPERSKVASSGFNFLHGRSEVHDGQPFRERSYSDPEKAVFVDSGLDNVESPESPNSPRLLKSAFLHGAGVGTETDVNSGEDMVESQQFPNHSSTFTLAAPHFKKAVPSLKDTFSEKNVRKEGVTTGPVYDDPTFENEELSAGELVDFQVIEDVVIRPDPWKTEDMSFEEVRLVGSQQTEEEVDPIDSPQWIGTIGQDRSSAQLPVHVIPQKATPITVQKRPVSENEKWQAKHDITDDIMLFDNGLTHNEKPTLVRKLMGNERPPKVHSLPEDAGNLSHIKSNAGSQVSGLKEKGDVDNAGIARNNAGKGSWKDVPIKTGLPLPLAEELKGLPPVVEPHGGQEGEKRAAQEDKATQGTVKAVEIPVVPRERSRSADGGLRSLEEEASRNTCDTQEELPRLPPVRLRSGDSKTTDIPKDGLVGSNSKPSTEAGVSVNMVGSTEAAFGLGSFLDIPVGQDVCSSGARRLSGGSRPSVSQGIVEDVSERLSGFATAGDGQSESVVEYPDEYWDSDTYDDDDDPGYHRQPIEDEEWFLAHEIDYPDERSNSGLESSRSHHDKDYGKYEDDDRSILEEESYFSGEEYYRTKRGERREDQTEVERLGASELYSRVEESQNGALRRQTGAQLRETTDYDGQLLDVEELNMIRGEPTWQGFPSQESRHVEGEDKVVHERAREDVRSVRSGGVGISSEVAEFGSEVRGSVVGGSSEGDLESLKDREMGGYGSAHSKDIRKDGSPKHRFNDVKSSQDVISDASGRNPDEEEVDHEMILRYYNETWSHKRENVERQISDRLFEQDKSASKGSNGNGEIHFQEQQEMGGFGFGGFSFPSPSSAGEIAVMSRADSGKSLWSVRDIVTLGRGDEGDEYANGIVGPDDTLAVWKRKSNESSPIISPRNETLRNLTLSTDSMISARSTDGYGSGEAKEVEDDETEINDITKEEADAVAADDEEAAAVQEQIRRIRAEEEEFETFNLKIVHRKNRTGFEEDKDFPVVINSVIAGRYHVTEYLGSAAFSKAIQAHDLHTGMDVCMKIIKNNKDFFDQSLDEIKLLKYINKHDPGDKHHVLRLYDYFYHREHLFIVCELLRANLYEFHKYNRESGGEVYFTMPRLQSITRQCLEALDFIHGLKLIHCDLKPENILVKSYSRCEVKVIDLGSSCFQTDHLCSYVQSRSYRAPEVILGLPYNQKIDMWSLGCILAELCSGNVLFQNDSLATLLARVVGILGPIDPEMLSKGRDTHKLFTKNHMLYERNQETEQLEYLLPKKTSLAHRLPMGDQGFVEFVGYLLQINPANRPTAAEALKHPWLSYPYEPISA
ncbi:unnamed protein product [Calypogeia fissa]